MQEPKGGGVGGSGGDESRPGCKGGGVQGEGGEGVCVGVGGRV